MQISLGAGGNELLRRAGSQPSATRFSTKKRLRSSDPVMCPKPPPPQKKGLECGEKLDRRVSSMNARRRLYHHALLLVDAFAFGHEDYGRRAWLDHRPLWRFKHSPVLHSPYGL
jgi:hypothetical protein